MHSLNWLYIGSMCALYLVYIGSIGFIYGLHLLLCVYWVDIWCAYGFILGLYCVCFLRI